MKVCGVDISASEARFAIAEIKDDTPTFVACKTKKMKLGDDKNADNLKAFLQAIKNFAHENSVDVFSLKARNHGGLMGGGAISFKIETLLQLSNTPVSFVNAVSLSKISKGNLGGVPQGVLAYQKGAYLCAIHHLNRLKLL